MIEEEENNKKKFLRQDDENSILPSSWFATLELLLGDTDIFVG